MRHRHCTKWNSAADCMGALLPPFSRRSGYLRTHCPPFRTRARAPNRRARRAPQRGLSLSPSPAPPPPSAAALFLHLSVPARSRSARSIPRSFVQSAWVSHSVHTHGRQIKSKWQTRSNSSKVDRAHQDPSPRILEDPLSQLTPAQDCRRCRRRPLPLRSPGRGPKKAQNRVHPEEPVCTSAFSGHHSTSLLSQLSVA